MVPFWPIHVAFEHVHFQSLVCDWDDLPLRQSYVEWETWWVCAIMIYEYTSNACILHTQKDSCIDVHDNQTSAPHYYSLTHILAIWSSRFKDITRLTIFDGTNASTDAVRNTSTANEEALILLYLLFWKNDIRWHTLEKALWWPAEPFFLLRGEDPFLPKAGLKRGLLTEEFSLFLSRESKPAGHRLRQPRKS